MSPALTSRALELGVSMVHFLDAEHALATTATDLEVVARPVAARH